MKITICTMAINRDYKEIVKYSLRSKQIYADKHNYNCIILTDDNNWQNIYDGIRHPPWYKMPLIKKIIEKGDSDYIVWIDADTQILNFEQKLEYFIEKCLINTNKEIAMIQENPLNTGIMFIRNSKFNYDLMDMIWNNPNDFYKPLWDQGSLCEIYERDVNVFNKIEAISHDIKYELCTFWGNYYPNKSFLIHMAGCSQDKLSFMYMMDSYYMFKLDEETDEQYKKRIEWLMDINLCRKDIDTWLSGQYIARIYSQRCLNFMKK